ncbi:unnamed protein product, partial [Cyprideis torosa]
MSPPLAPFVPPAPVAPSVSGGRERSGSEASSEESDGEGSPVMDLDARLAMMMGGGAKKEAGGGAKTEGGEGLSSAMRLLMRSHSAEEDKDQKDARANGLESSSSEAESPSSSSSDVEDGEYTDEKLR